MTKQKGWNLHSVTEQLAQVRDEIKLKLHLAQADAHDEWERLEKKWEELQSKAKQMQNATEKITHDIQATTEKIATDVQTATEKAATELRATEQTLVRALEEGYERLKKTFKGS